MWATIEDLNLKNKDCKDYIEKNGILIFNKKGLENIQNKVDVADTQFLQVGKKIHDISGYTTGIGLNVKEVFKLMKKKNAFKFKSNFNLPMDCNCIDTISEDILEIFPYDILEDLDSKLFFCIEDKEKHGEDIRIPSRLEDCKNTQFGSVRIYFLKSY